MSSAPEKRKALGKGLSALLPARPVAAAPPSAKIDLGAFPIDIRFTVVVVAPGATFSGWQNYP